MTPTKCTVAHCRNLSDYQYLERPLCARCWNRYDRDELRQKLKVKEGEADAEQEDVQERPVQQTIPGFAPAAKVLPAKVQQPIPPESV